MVNQEQSISSRWIEFNCEKCFKMSPYFFGSHLCVLFMSPLSWGATLGSRWDLIRKHCRNRRNSLRKMKLWGHIDHYLFSHPCGVFFSHSAKFAVSTRIIIIIYENRCLFPLFRHGTLKWFNMTDSHINNTAKSLNPLSRAIPESPTYQNVKDKWDSSFRNVKRILAPSIAPGIFVGRRIWI